jgi:hypothetical protein
MSLKSIVHIAYNFLNIDLYIGIANIRLEKDFITFY